MFNPLGPVKISPSIKVNKSLEDRNNLLLQLAMRKTKDNEVKKIQSINQIKNKDEKNLLTKTLIKNMEKMIDN